MKQLKKNIIETSLDKIGAYKAVNTNTGISAKEAVGSEFKLKNYVIYEGTVIETDEVTGEVINKTVTNNVILETNIGYIGSNSPTIIGSLKDMIDNLGMETILEMPLVITSGKAKSGNTFYDLELA